MNDLHIAKMGFGYVVDVTPLEAGDTVVVFADAWPHNFSNIEFKQVSQWYSNIDSRVYVGKVNYKPSQAMQINSVQEPRVIVLKKEES